MTDKTIILPPQGNGNGHAAGYKLTVMVPKRRYLSYLRERWWVVLVFLLICVGGIVTYETLRPETYASYAQLHAAGDVQVYNTGTVFNEDAQNYFGTQVELLKSPALQGAALEKSEIILKPTQVSPYKIDVVQPLKTSILRLQATGPDPSLTQRYLQNLIDAYLAYKKETRRNSSDELISSLAAELQKRENELKLEQEKSTDFQRSNNVAVLEEESKAAGLYLAELNVQAAKLELERELLTNGIAMTEVSAAVPAATNGERAVTGISLATNVASFASSSSGDLMLKSARVELAALRAEKARSELNPLHPAMRRLEDEIAVAEKRVANLEQQNLEQKKLELQELQTRIGAVKTAIPPLEAKVLAISEKLAESQRLKNNIQRLQNYYENLLSTFRNVDVSSKNMQHENLSLLQPPTRARLQERYLPMRVVVATVFGLFLGCALVFGWYLLDDRFVSVRDVKDQFGEMVLGLVPQVRLPRAKPQAALLREHDDRRAYAECYRHLRSALMLSSTGGSRPQALLFTGAAPGEGKTTVAVNLARLLARSGLRVTVVDVDAHGRGITHLLGADDKAGVLDFLRQQASLSEIVHPCDVPNLSIVPAGSQSQNGEGLLLQPQLKELLEGLKPQNDFIIFDSPPILSADDGALLVPHVDSVVLVACPFFTRSRELRQALDMLYQRQAKQVSIVLNRARKDDLAGLLCSKWGFSRAQEW